MVMKFHSATDSRTLPWDGRENNVISTITIITDFYWALILCSHFADGNNETWNSHYLLTQEFRGSNGIQASSLGLPHPSSQLPSRGLNLKSADSFFSLATGMFSRMFFSVGLHKCASHNNLQHSSRGRDQGTLEPSVLITSSASSYKNVIVAAGSKN